MSARRTFIVGVCFFVLVAIGVFYLSYKKQPVIAPDTPAIATMTTEAAGARTVPDGWREYQNIAYRFSLLHPQGLEVKEYPEGGNALTLTFQNVKEQKGFQIFIVPYEEPQVSEERFKRDLPSGVRANLTNIIVDGATGAAFYSANTLLGETREVWFIYGGFLYEVTTLKSLEMWLDSVMQTWKFI